MRATGFPLRNFRGSPRCPTESPLRFGPQILSSRPAEKVLLLQAEDALCADPQRLGSGMKAFRDFAPRAHASHLACDACGSASSRVIRGSRWACRRGRRSDSWECRRRDGHRRATARPRAMGGLALASILIAGFLAVAGRTPLIIHPASLPSAARRRKTPPWGSLLTTTGVFLCPATTYSPTGSPLQYHRR